MLSDLQKVQDNFYSNQSIADFLKAHKVHEAIKLLNKTNKAETRTRIKTFFYKISDSDLYKEFLLAGVDENAQHKAQFHKYISSEFSEEYFTLLQKKVPDVQTLLENNMALTPLIFSLVYSPTYGIKMIKVFAELYAKHADHNNLYTQQIRTELDKGLKTEDSVVQMRFVEIIANIATHGGKAFEFVKDVLEKSLNLYETEDILLKLNIVQIVSILGGGSETSKLLRDHKIWSKVEKDALDPNQQFYVRKCLLILLVDMANYEQYTVTPKFIKSEIEFLGLCFKGQGQQLQAGLQLASHLLRSNQGAKVLVQNTEVFGSYLKLSRSPQDRIKNLFVDNLTVLTDKSTGKKTKPVVLNILSCVGNPNLSGQLSHNPTSGNLISGGIDGFCKWFVGLLQLPFEDLEIKLLGLFLNLLEYTQICQQLFQNQNTTKYILKPVGKGNTVKVLRNAKNLLVHTLIEKGNKEWKNTKLEHYSVMIEKELHKEKMEMEIDMEAN